MTTPATLRPSRFGSFPKDLTGRRFGRLLVLSFDRIETSGSGRSSWYRYWCRCDCGVVKSIIGGNLKAKRGATVSCGCFQREDMSFRASHMTLGTPEERVMRHIQAQYKSRARRGKRVYALSFAEFVAILRSSCTYCGTPPENNHTFRSRSLVAEPGFTFAIPYSGIDRVDSSLGYTSDNVVPCCKVCNIAKRAMSTEEFAAWVRRVSSHLLLTAWDEKSTDEEVIHEAAS